MQQRATFRRRLSPPPPLVLATPAPPEGPETSRSLVLALPLMLLRLLRRRPNAGAVSGARDKPASRFECRRLWRLRGDWIVTAVPPLLSNDSR